MSNLTMKYYYDILSILIEYGNSKNGGTTMQEFETSVTEKGQVTIPQEKGIS
jgi:hypothetical protein